VRTIIADILDPLAERSIGHHLEIKEMKTAIDVIHKKVEDIDRSLKVDLNLKQFLQDIKKRQSLMVSEPYNDQNNYYRNPTRFN